MKLILVFLVMGLTVVHAGVQTLSVWEDLQKMQEFSNLCLSGQVGHDGREINGVLVYCKVATNRRREGYSHFVNKNFEGAKPQTVFLRPPTLELTHNITVRGSFKGGKTKVYVAPSPVENKYLVDVDGKQGTPEKPTVYYLQGGSTERPVIEPGIRYLPPSVGREYGVPEVLAAASHNYKIDALTQDEAGVAYAATPTVKESPL